MAFLPGKFARFRTASTAVSGAFRWNVNFRRERLDTTNFESATDGVNNVFSEGLTGPVDTTFSVEMYAADANVNVFFPGSSLTCDLLYRKTVQLGYTSIAADVLTFTGNTTARQQGMCTAELQANGAVSSAA